MFYFYLWKIWYIIVNDIRNFVFGLAETAVYGSCKSRKQKFVMSFTIIASMNHFNYLNVSRRINFHSARQLNEADRFSFCKAAGMERG